VTIQDIMARAEALAEEFARAGTMRLEPAHKTFAPNDECCLEWWRGARKVTFYVGAEKADYIRVWGPDVHAQMDDGAVTPEILPWLHRWLVGQCTGCGRPFESPDFDPRCSSCAESGTEPIPKQLFVRSGTIEL
jgi:hypothetical protein